MKNDVAPSILAADILNMEKDIQRVLDAGAKCLHVDIMDGHFVPNISFGPNIVKALRQAFPSAYIDVHLMLSKPSEYIDKFIDAGSNEITVHIEIDENKKQIIEHIKNRGVKAGLSIKPKTEPEVLDEYLPLIDQVLVMSVEPGFGGQKMMPECLQKLNYLKEKGFLGIISVDGGIGRENMDLAVKKGANRLVMGTSLFKADDMKKLIDDVRGLFDE